MKKHSKSNSDRVILAAIIIAAVLTVCLPSGVLIKRHLDKRFTPEKWAENPYGRLEIFDDMYKKHPLTGMSEAEITVLLGEENYADDVVRAEQTIPAESVLIYHLGAEGFEEIRLVVFLSDGIASEIGYLYDGEFSPERK